MASHGHLEIWDVLCGKCLDIWWEERSKPVEYFKGKLCPKCFKELQDYPK